MSTEVEQRVVEMQFDNKQFERNVSTTMSSLDKLKQSLNLTGAAKGLESVGTAAKGINLSVLTGAAETVGLKFNAMWTIADQALRNITNSAYYAGKRIVSALTIDPIKTGFAEYETQINAVQTILANTKSKGTNIDDVNGALDELNTYADKTIYNFTEMTRNIGTFTAAGVDLDKSVTSIKGIANLAAVSGSTSQQASTAMYQLSQALAAGKVQLMDWNSVVNAGMGGEVFQNALKRTAKNMGTDVDALIKKYGSFRESLTQGEWLTADVLTETLTQLSGAYTEADLLAKGYTKDQAKEILELAATAESAATDVKTFTQLWDTLKESAQSGWTQTWEILVGDFEEAKKLLSGVSKVIGKMIGDSADARNELLKGWKDAGGRADLIEGFKSAFEGLMNIIKPIKEAFRNIFPPTTVVQLYNLSAGFKNLMAKFEEFTASHGDQIRTTFEGIFSVIDIGWTFVKRLIGGVGDLLGKMSGLGGNILDTASNMGEWLIGLRDTVKETDIFGTAIDKVVGFLSNVIDKIKEFGTTAKEAFSSSRFEGFLGFFKGLWSVITKIGTRVGEIFAPLGEAISNAFTNASISDVLNDGIFAAILVGVYKFVDNLNGPLESIKDLFEGLAGEDGIKGILDSVKGCIESYQNSLNADTIKKIATAIAILAAAIFVISSIDGDKLDHSLGAITILFAELMGSLAIFNKMDFGTKGLVKGVAAINGLATALLILSVAMKIMSTMSWNEIAVGITGTVAGLAALVGAVNLLPEGNVLKSSKAIGKLATALVILAAGMKIMASMSWQELGVALAGVVGGLGILVGAVNLLPKDAAIRSLGMIGLATSLVILGGALKLMATMSWDEIGRGLAVMGGALLELAIALNLMNGTLAGSAALIIAAGALAIMTPVLLTLGSMSWEAIGKGLVALAGAFAVIGVAGLLLTPLIPTLLGLAAAFALFGIATLGIGAGLTLIGVGISSIATALAAGTTAIVAGVAAIIGGILGLIPTIVLGLGEGILALCTVIKECAPAIVETLFVLLAEICTSIATYTPIIAGALFDLLIGALNVLAEKMPELIQAAFNLIGSFFQGIVDTLKGMDTNVLMEGIVGVGFIAALMAGLSLLTPLIPSAMIAVLGMGVLIAELALMLAAVGALAQIPGLSWLIGEGGDLLQQIGTAIGQFVGGLIGGIAEGATSTLPQVGTNLSNFMTNLQPFITGMQGLDSTMVDNAKTLASAILALTAADLLSGITSFFKGGTSLADFGAEISEFGTMMKDYSKEVAGIDTEAVTASVNAAQKLVKMASDIPSDGVFGTDGIDDFGKNMVSFGKSIKKFSDAIADVGTGMIDKTVSAVRSLIGVINSMAGIDASGVTEFTTAVNKLGKTNFDAVAKAATTSTAKLINVGKNIFTAILDGAETTRPKFTTVTNTLIVTMLDAVKSKVIQIKVAFTSMMSTVLTTLSNYRTNFYNAGAYLVSGFTSGISANRYKAAAQAKAMAAAAAEAARRELDEHSPSKVGYEIGDFFGIAFVNAIADNVKRAYTASADLANSAKTGLKNAFDKVGRIISGEVDINPTIRPVLDLTDVRSGANALGNMLGLTPSVGVLANVGAVSAMMNQRSQVASNDDVVYAINKLQKALANVGNTTNYINGVTYDDGSNVNNAVAEIVRYAKIERRV